MPNTTKIQDTDLHDFYNGETPTEADFDKNPQLFKGKINGIVDDLTSLEGEERTTETVKGNAEAIEAHKTSTDHDDRYYTEDEVDAIKDDLAGTGRTTETIKRNSDSIATLTTTVNNNETDIENKLSVHKSSEDHDARYYRESEVDAIIAALEGEGHSTQTIMAVYNLCLSLQDQINALNNTFSTDAERIAAISDVINQFEIADDDLEALINLKANASSVYTKSEVDGKVFNTANISDRAITAIKIALGNIKNEHYENGSITAEKLASSLLASVDDVIINARFENLENKVWSTIQEYQKSLIPHSDGCLDGMARFRMLGQTAINSIINGNFANGTDGWDSGSSALSVSNNILFITGDGANYWAQASQTTNIPIVAGKKIYVKTRIRVTTSDSTILRCYIEGSSTQGTRQFAINQSTPTINDWYDVSAILTIPSDAVGYVKIVFQHQCADAETINGKIMEAEPVMMLDLGTDTSNPLYTKTAEELAEMFPIYWEGMSHATVDKTSYGKNRFDRGNVAVGYVISDSNGNLSANNAFVSSDFMKIDKYNDFRTQTILPYVVRSIFFYDKNKNYINSLSLSATLPYSNISIEDMPNNALYARTITRRTDSASLTQTDINIILNTMMFFEGTAETPYEPYQPPRTFQLPYSLTEVPSARDEVRNSVEVDGELVYLGRTEHIKRNEPYTLQSEDIGTLVTGTYVDWVTIQTSVFTELKEQTSAIDGSFVIEGFPTEIYGAGDAEGNEYKFNTISNVLYLIIPKGTYASLAEAQADLVNTPLVYQRAEEEITVMEDTPTLLAYKDGYMTDNSTIPTLTRLSLPQNYVAQGQGTTEAVMEHDKQIVDMNTKLASVEEGAEVNQTDSEILAQIKNVDGTGSGLNADMVDNAHKSTDDTLSSNSDYHVPTEKAVKAYTDNKKQEIMTYVDTKYPSARPFVSVQDVTYYVDYTNGADSNNGLTTSTAKKTYDALLNILPIFINHDINIYQIGNYIGDVYIDNIFVGSRPEARFSLEGYTSDASNHVISGVLDITNTRGKFTDIKIEYLKAEGTTISSSSLLLYNCGTTGDPSQASLEVNSSHVRIQSCDIGANNTLVGIRCYLGFVESINVTGTSDQYGLYATAGGVIAKSGTQPTGGIANERTENGGTIR